MAYSYVEQFKKKAEEVEAESVTITITKSQIAILIDLLLIAEDDKDLDVQRDTEDILFFLTEIADAEGIHMKNALPLK